jgi:hypothetical protein
MPPRVSKALAPFLVFAGALLLFGPTAVNFVPRVTDISALRLLDGEVPYRDFWTMYAPGSFVTVALAFKLFGRELIVSSVLGIVITAAAVAVYFRLVQSTAGSVAAVLLAALVALAFYGSGYHNGLTTYPPAILLILAAALITSARVARPGARWALLPGLLLGAAGLYKHDIAGYAAIAVCGAVVFVRARARLRPVLAPAVIIGMTAAGILVTAAAVLAAFGAGPDAWDNLIRFPLGDFRNVRGEYIPVLPAFRPSLVDTAQELTRWGQGMLPVLAFLLGALGLWLGRGPDLPPRVLFVAAFATLAFWLHWWAAHVQMNTNAITLAAWGGLFGALGLARSGLFRRSPLVGLAAAVVVAGWSGVYVAERAYNSATRPPMARERIGLPGLAGLSAPSARASELRRLAAAIAEAAEPDAPLLFLSRRNDITVYAASSPFWLTPRRPATRYHEIHPGVTDVEWRQREMIAALEAGPLPVVVREHRFADHYLDSVKSMMQARVPVGATAIDTWVADRYESGPRFGSYEVMRLSGARIP